MNMLLNIVVAAGLLSGVFGLIAGALLRQGAPTPRGVKLGHALAALVVLLWGLVLVAFTLVYIGA